MLVVEIFILKLLAVDGSAARTLFRRQALISYATHEVCFLWPLENNS